MLKLPQEHKDIVLALDYLRSEMFLITIFLLKKHQISAVDQDADSLSTVHTQEKRSPSNFMPVSLNFIAVFLPALIQAKWALLNIYVLIQIF